MQTSILTDIANAFGSYPIDEVIVEIVDVALLSGTQPVINTGETWKFKVIVVNNGHVNMTGVSLHILGLNGTQVSESPTTGFSNLLLGVGALTLMPLVAVRRPISSDSQGT